MSRNLDLVARMLRYAYHGPPIAPLRDFLDPLDAEGAYAVQALNTKYWESQGRKLVGRKIGLTADSVRRQLGVDQPDFGALFADMEIPDAGVRSEEHTSELQSLMRLSYAVFYSTKKTDHTKN